jgi:negative regulator of flagellin synthesis FlgM
VSGLRISSQHILGIQKAYNQQNKPGKTGSADRPAREDGVSISQEARLLSVALKAIQERPEVDAQKVEELKAAVRDGTYQVSSEDLADRIWAENWPKK